MFPVVFKMGQPRLFFVFSQSFQTNSTIFRANQREKMSFSSSVWCQDSNPWPFENESSPITTRPGLSLLLPYMTLTCLFSSCFEPCHFSHSLFEQILFQPSTGFLVKSNGELTFKRFLVRKIAKKFPASMGLGFLLNKARAGPRCAAWFKPEVNHRSKLTKLRGFICAYHPAAPGSNPKHTIYAFFNLYYWNCIKKITKVNKKRPGLAHFF